MGRFKKEKNLSRKITVRISEEQYEILSLIADYSGITISDLVRGLILNLILRFKLGQPISILIEEEGENEDSLCVSCQEKSIVQSNK